MNALCRLTIYAIGDNMLKKCLFPNIDGKMPTLGKNIYIDQNSVIIGDVIIEDGVYISPNAVIRCDEPPTKGIIIKENVNIQDGAVIHCLSGTGVIIGEDSSISHCTIIHGHAKIGNKSFIGFNSTVFNAEIGDNVVVGHNSVIDGTGAPIKIPNNKWIPPNSSIYKDEDGILKAFLSNGKIITDFMELPELPEWYKSFPNKVVNINNKLNQGYIDIYKK